MAGVLLWVISNPERTGPAGGDQEMDAIEMLMGEHRIIERVLDALDGFVDEVERRGSSEREELGRFVTFVREFADACHHGKEEDILFAAMVAHGFPREGGPIAVMLHEHDRGRALISVLRGHAEAESAWTDAARREIADAARGYASLLRAHIHKEDAIHLPSDAMQEVADACARYEEGPARAGDHARLHALAEELIRVHAAAVHPGEARAHRAGCCG